MCLPYSFPFWVVVNKKATRSRGYCGLSLAILNVTTRSVPKTLSTIQPIFVLKWNVNLPTDNQLKNYKLHTVSGQMICLVVLYSVLMLTAWSNMITKKHIVAAFILFICISASILLSDLNDFPKARREDLRATAYEGFDVKCLPPKSGYACEDHFFVSSCTLSH